MIFQKLGTFLAIAEEEDVYEASCDAMVRHGFFPVQRPALNTFVAERPVRSVDISSEARRIEEPRMQAIMRQTNPEPVPQRLRHENMMAVATVAVLEEAEGFSVVLLLGAYHRIHDANWESLRPINPTTLRESYVSFWDQFE